MAANPEKNYEIGLLLDQYGALLTGRQREVTDLYYNDDLSLSEVAEECGITRQGVRDALLKAEEQLRRFEEILGLLAKQDENRKLAAQLSREAAALKEAGAHTEELTRLIERLSP